MLIGLLLCLALLWSTPSQAQYDLTLFNLPFGQAPAITGYSPQGTRIGLYQDGNNQALGFLRVCGSEVIPLPLVAPRALNAATSHVGTYVVPGLGTRGYVLHAGTFQPLIGPPQPLTNALPIQVEALDLNDTPVVVGSVLYADGVGHGFRYTVATHAYTILDAPGAIDTVALRIAHDGRILVKALAAEGTVSYFLWDAGTFTPLDLPSLPSLEVVGRLPSGSLIGNTTSGPTTTGWIWDGTTVTIIQHSGSAVTQLFGNDVAGRLYGRADNHGFLAVPTGTPDPCEGRAREDTGHQDKPDKGPPRPR